MNHLLGEFYVAKLRIKEVAEARGVKQSHLQIAAAVTPPLLNRYWNNKTTSVDLTELEKIALALGVEPEELIVSDAKYAKLTKSSEETV
jgi:DNA-binding Xre family transcriptional regulator